ncbi:MAG: four helix bundle protein [Ignavibacteriaceae bacterium]
MMNENKNRKYDLEARLIDFAVLIIEITESLNNTRAGNHLAGQLVRSGTSPALQYGEAQSAESRNDFIHKLKILLKELRETLVALKIIKRVSLTKKIEKVDNGIIECNELISIFVTSVGTAKKNINKRK